jgi:Asp-tRNA(Asn)/Glu-tRNA(Gln) amidotransferase A subunit family amidase
MKNLHYLSVSEAARLLADYTITAEAMMCACFDQIEVREAEVGAWSYYGANRGLTAAARMLDGMPI